MLFKRQKLDAATNEVQTLLCCVKWEMDAKRNPERNKKAGLWTATDSEYPPGDFITAMFGKN